MSAQRKAVHIPLSVVIALTLCLSLAGCSGEAPLEPFEYFGVEEPLQALSPDYDREDAAREGALVLTEKGVENADALAGFLARVSAGETASLRLYREKDWQRCAREGAMELRYDGAELELAYFLCRDSEDPLCGDDLHLERYETLTRYEDGAQVRYVLSHGGEYTLAELDRLSAGSSLGKLPQYFELCSIPSEQDPGPWQMPETGAAPPSPLEEVSRDLTPAQAEKDGWVVMEDGALTGGISEWNEFFRELEQGEPASLRLYRQFTRDDPEVYEGEENTLAWGLWGQRASGPEEVFPVRIFHELTFDGEKFSVTSLRGEHTFEESFLHLKCYEEETEGDVRRCWVLLNQPEHTWDELMERIGTNGEVPMFFLWSQTGQNK